ncbi:lipopolysaccharide biosynthesis protein [Variovorax boronicumulans]|uniref:lipopolysaccharide biosynthesis protein n=1 Tax=Variovorax boronicumulans TaxID=436515 RepID=UPI003390E3AE
MARLSALRKRLGGPVWAVADQCIYSASQLLLSFALARVLSPSDFGVASAFLAVASFQYILHTAMVHEPLLIQRHYANRAAAWTSWGLVVVFSLAGYLAWQLAVFPGEVRWVGVALIVGYEVFWISRTLLFTGRRYAMLCVTGVLVGAGYVAVLGIERPSSWSEALLWVSLLQMPFLLLVVLNLRHVMPVLPAAKTAKALTVRASMGYGWKASLSQFMSWIMTGGAILLLGSSADAQQGGLLKIYITFLLPMQYVLAALGYYLLPQLAAGWHSTDRKKAFGLFVKFVLLGFAVAEIGGVALGLLGPHLVVLAFGENYRHMDFSPFYYAPAIFGLTMCLRTGFRAASRPGALLVCSVVGAAVFGVCMALAEPPVSYIHTIRAMTLGFACMAALMIGWLFVLMRAPRPA